MREQSDLGPYCLQKAAEVYKQMKQQIKIVANGGKRDKYANKQKGLTMIFKQSIGLYFM